MKKVLHSTTFILLLFNVWVQSRGIIIELLFFSALWLLYSKSNFLYEFQRLELSGSNRKLTILLKDLPLFKVICVSANS
jgi:hypothetical protein